MPGTNDSLPSRAPVLRALVDICGPDFARSARSVDVVAGRRASFVAVPATVDAVVATVELAARRNLAPMARGSGSKISWGLPPRGVDLLVDTGRLSGLWDTDAEARTVEVGAGTPVSALQAALALRGLRLAADPPSPNATVGGMLAVNESGPLRHRFGSPAEAVNHVSYVDAAGRVGRSDGEQGRPGIGEIDGVITSANLRLESRPEARRWVVVPVDNPLRVRELVDEVLAQGAEVSAVEVDLPGPRAGELAVLAEGDRAEVSAAAGRLAASIGGAVTEVAPAWWGRYPFDARDVALRLAAPIADLHAALYALRDAAGGSVPVRGSAGVGAVHAVLPGSLPAERVEAILESVRSVLMARTGRAVIISAPPPVSRQVDMAGRRDLF